MATTTEHGPVLLAKLVLKAGDECQNCGAIKTGGSPLAGFAETVDISPRRPLVLFITAGYRT